MEAKELFISYGRDPIVTKFVHKLKTDLEAVGFSVWLDSEDIPAGSDWHGAIGAGLSNCKAILPIMTKKFLTSRYCVNELYTADSDKKLIFPIMFENVDFDASESGQGVKYATSSVNWTMCRLGQDDYNDSISRLISAMKAKGLGGGESSETESKSIAPSSSAPVFKPLIGPCSAMPFKVVPDVENPEGITVLQNGGLAVSIAQQKVLIFNSNHEKVLELGGEPGLGMGQFLSPTGVAVDSEGNLLVVCHYFVQKFDANGKFLQQVGGPGQKDGSFTIDSPRGLAIGRNGRMYITEQQKHRVTILNSDLTLYKRFSDADRMLGSGHLNLPQGLAINSNGDVYVADMMNHVVQVFDSEGTFLFRFGGMGHGPGTTSSPTSVAIDQEDYVYIGTAAGTVSIFSREGKFVRAFGEHGAEIGKFNMIRALHLDSNGVLYVGEWTTNRIQMFETRDSTSAVTTGGTPAEVDEITTQAQELALHQTSPSPLQQLPSAALNITGEGKGMTVIGGSVNIGKNVIFRSHVAIQPGSNVVGHGGNTQVPIPVAVPAANESSGGRDEEGGGVVFAKSANVTCKQAGTCEPLRVLETDEIVTSMAVNEAGDLVVSGKKTIMLYNSKYEKQCQLSDRDISGSHVAFRDKHEIIAITYLCIVRMNLKLEILSKVQPHQSKGSNLAELTVPYALAIGDRGRLYIAGNKKCHIVDSDLSTCKSFADDCGQAFGIAVGKTGHVFVPVQKLNTVCVFSDDGDSLFRFGGPDRAPLPHMSLLAPISIALDHHDNVYVGIGLQSIVKFDKDGKFLGQFAGRVNFEAIPSPMCTDPDRHCLYVGRMNQDKIQVYSLQ